MEIPALHQLQELQRLSPPYSVDVDRWVSLCAFCESHRSAIGTVNAVGTVMEIPALHQPTRTTRTILRRLISVIMHMFRHTRSTPTTNENYSF